MSINLPSPEVMRKLLRYDEDTGKLFWNARTPDMFSSGYRSSVGNCRNWNARHAGKEAFTSVSKGYLVGSVFKVKMKSHRVVWAIVNGVWPKNQIDHIDGNRSNNKIDNLREVTNLENHRNMKKSCSNGSGYMGVYKHGERWRVKICNKHIGVFDDLEQAIDARLIAQRQYGFHPNHGRDYVK
jgi:hypothetical protein